MSRLGPPRGNAEALLIAGSRRSPGLSFQPARLGAVTENQRIHLLRDRLAGRPADTTLHEGTPEWLLPGLRDWLEAYAYEAENAMAVALELRLAPVKGPRGSRDYEAALIQLDGLNLLTAIDAALQLDTRWCDFRFRYGVEEHAKNLEEILWRGGSYLRFDFEGNCLMRRVDETAQVAYDTARENAPDDASDHLKKAWHSAYQVNPDPDDAYGEAILAVEAVLTPLVHPNATKATFSHSYNALRDQAAAGQWTLNFGDPQRPTAESIDKLIGMCKLLLEHHDYRHAGGQQARQQTQAEAEAAVHLAVLLVQWISTGVLKKKEGNA